MKGKYHHECFACFSVNRTFNQFSHCFAGHLYNRQTSVMFHFVVKSTSDESSADIIGLYLRSTFKLSFTVHTPLSSRLI